MNEILFHYQKVNPTTWVYLASLLMIGLYFKFSRFWSVRNLDLVLLILLSPGLLIAQYGGELSDRAMRVALQESTVAGSSTPEPTAQDSASGTARLEAAAPAWAVGDSVVDDRRPEDTAAEVSAAQDWQDSDETSGAPDSKTEAALKQSRAIERFGFLWLFAIGGVWLIRLLLDPTMVRRPLLEPNLTTGGLVFLGASLFVFLMANVWASQRIPVQYAAARPVTVQRESLAAVVSEPATRADEPPTAAGPRELDALTDDGSMNRGPGYALLNLVPAIPTMPMIADGARPTSKQRTYAVVAKVIAVLAHLAVVLGIAAIGYWHFGNTKTGVGVATLYLMLPYTAQMTGHIDHVIPATLLIWAVLCYRRPQAAGMLLGLATGLVYYPLFLLPLWISFYWRRGLMRFAAGVLLMLGLLAISLAFIPHASYWENLKHMFGLWSPRQAGLQGIWGLGWEPLYRIPVLTAFIVLSLAFAIWPAQKNLGTLLSCSAALMVATQFWHGYGGGLYMGWYLPLALLTVFRPNLEDRVALTVLGEGRTRRRAPRVMDGFRAA